MDRPLDVGLAQQVSTLSKGPGWGYESKLDGGLGVLWRRETVRIQTRSGRDAAARWFDVAAAATALTSGTFLDGELIIRRDGRTDFGAVRSWASARGRRVDYLVRRWHRVARVWFEVFSEQGAEEIVAKRARGEFPPHPHGTGRIRFHFRHLPDSRVPRGRY